MLDKDAVLPVKVLRATVLQSAWDSYLDFKRNALEIGQIRAEWRESNTLIELAVAGDTENFLREFKSYYDTNKSLGASYRFEEELPYLEVSEALLSLRQGVLWHDGEPFTSEDVLFSYELSGRQPWDRAIHDLLERVRAVTAVDAHTVRIDFRGFDPAPLEKWSTIPMLPKHRLDGKNEELLEKEFDENPVGTGPLRLATGEHGAERGAMRGDRLVLARNANYFLGSPGTDRWVFLKVSDSAERRLRFLGGEFDSYLLDKGGAGAALLKGRYEVFPVSAEPNLEKEKAFPGSGAERSYRVMRTGVISVSRALGDGHRVEKELEAVAPGVDFLLPWWVKK